MEKKTTPLENNLKRLVPAPLELPFLDRLEAASNDQLTDLSPEDVEFEILLKNNRPAEIPNELRESLLDAVKNTPFTQDEKIVLLHRGNDTNEKIVKGRFLRWDIGAAAAIALFGAFMAFSVSLDSHETQERSSGVPTTIATANPTGGEFTPVSLGSIARDSQQLKNLRPEVQLEYVDEKTAKNRD